MCTSASQAVSWCPSSRPGSGWTTTIPSGRLTGTSGWMCFRVGASPITCRFWSAPVGATRGASTSPTFLPPKEACRAELPRGRCQRGRSCRSLQWRWGQGDVAQQPRPGLPGQAASEPDPGRINYPGEVLRSIWLPGQQGRARSPPYPQRLRGHQLQLHLCDKLHQGCAHQLSQRDAKHQRNTREAEDNLWGQP